MEGRAEYRAMFAEEARENLEEWERSLLELERNPHHDSELINRMFRAIHTLKGSAGFIGLDTLQKMAHGLESGLQHVRDGAARLTPGMVDMLFQGLDLSKRLVDAFTEDRSFVEGIDAFLGTLCARQEPAAEGEQPLGAGANGPAVQSGSALGAAPEGRRHFQLELLIQSSGQEAFLRAFLVRRRLAGVARIVSEDPTPEVLKDSKGRFAYWLTLDTDRDQKCILEALNIDLLEITSIEELNGDKQPAARRKTAHGEGSPVASSTGSAPRTFTADEVVRVSVQRLDTLLNLVGELVIQNSGFLSIGGQLREQYGRSLLISDLQERTEALTKVTRDLQDGIMKVRMLPVTNVFSRFHRVVRDLARDRNKEVTLQVFGEKTEIDKKVMDRIGDPLVHLVRNAVDHGIESREERLAAGKAAAGLIRLGAYQDGDHICIEVSDDGRGLDEEAILRTAVERGLIGEQEAITLSDEQVLSLIFLPGFTTAREVTELSGRGVGMDVVRKAVEEMSGNVRVRSFAGRGTTVTISLPLTMAIISALLVEVGGSKLAIPLSSVKEVLKVTASDLKTIGTRPVINLRNEVLAMVHLGEALSLRGDGGPPSADQKVPVVIVDYEEKRIGLAVSRIFGTGEIVIKSLSRHYREIEGLIGASILGNGSIALIVDIEALVRLYHHVDEDERAFTGTSVYLAKDNAGPVAAAPKAAEAAQGSEKTAARQEVDGRSLDQAPGQRTGRDSSTGCGPDDLAGGFEARKGTLLEHIHNTGAIQASMSVSQMTGREVRVSFPESRIVLLGDVGEMLGGEEVPVAGLYVGLKGDLTGGMVIVIPQENLLHFHDLLHHQELGTCASVADVDLSGISELGNVISASFINAMSNETRLSVTNETPEIGVDMCQSVIDSVLARFSGPGEHLLLTRAFLFWGDGQKATCHLLLFLEPDSLRKLTDAVADTVA